MRAMSAHVEEISPNEARDVGPVGESERLAGTAS